MGHLKRAMADTISDELGISKTIGRQFLNKVLDMIADDIVYTGEAKFKSFGKFHTTTRPPQTIKHPITGKTIHVPEKNIVQFKTSEVIKRRLNPEN